MNDHEGEQFFDLLRQIVDLPGMTWEEKRQQGRDGRQRGAWIPSPHHPMESMKFVVNPLGPG